MSSTRHVTSIVRHQRSEVPSSGAKAAATRPRGAATSGIRETVPASAVTSGTERALPAGETSSAAADLGVRGAQLSDEEAAALVAVLAQLASAEQVINDAGGTGPADRTLQRKHRLDSDQHGLWGRPGRSSWNQATGGRR